VSGLLFLFEISVMVLVVWWAYQTDRPGGGGASTGLLGMVDEGSEVPAVNSSPVRGWAVRDGDRVMKSRSPSPGGSAPRWRRGPGHPLR
jgi:hypothetical protein